MAAYKKWLKDLYPFKACAKRAHEFQVCDGMCMFRLKSSNGLHRSDGLQPGRMISKT